MDLNEEIRGMTSKINRMPARSNGGEQEVAGPSYDFVNLGQKVADVMIHAAEEQLTAAQNQLQEIKAWADNMKAGLKQKDRELAAMNEKLEIFGKSVLSAYHAFNGEAKVVESREDPLPAIITRGPRPSE